MKRLGILALAFALMAGVVSANELRRHPMTGETVPAPIRDIPGGGQIAIHNYDWVPYTIEVHPHSGRLVVQKGEGGGRRSVVLPPGARVYIPSPQQVWSMQGNNGRAISIGVRHGRKIDVDLVPDGNRDMVGLEAIVKDHHHQEVQLIVAWEPRHRDYWPQDPAPTPYHPIPVIGQDPPYGHPIPVIGQDPPSGYPVPVIGQDPPPYHRIPIVGVDPPPPQYIPHIRY